MQFLAFIVALVKAIPSLEKTFLTLIDLYYTAMDAKDENETTKVMTEREKLIAKLRQKDLTDEERNNIRKALYSLSKR